MPRWIWCKITFSFAYLLQCIKNGLSLLGCCSCRYFYCMRWIWHICSNCSSRKTLCRCSRHNLFDKMKSSMLEIFWMSWFQEWMLTWMVWRAFGCDDTDTGMIRLPSTIWFGCAWRMICCTVTVPCCKFFGFCTISWVLPTGVVFVPTFVPVVLTPVILPLTWVICVILPAATAAFFLCCCCPIGICCSCICRTPGRVAFNWLGLIWANVIPTVPPVDDYLKQFQMNIWKILKIHSDILLRKFLLPVALFGHLPLMSWPEQYAVVRCPIATECLVWIAEEFVSWLVAVATGIVVAIVDVALGQLPDFVALGSPFAVWPAAFLL